MVFFLYVHTFLLISVTVIYTFTVALHMLESLSRCIQKESEKVSIADVQLPLVRCSYTLTLNRSLRSYSHLQHSSKFLNLCFRFSLMTISMYM